MVVALLMSDLEALLLVEAASSAAKEEVEREQAHTYDCVVVAERGALWG